MSELIPSFKALVIPNGKTEIYRKSGIVDADSGLPIMLPLDDSPEAAAIAAKAAASACQLLTGLNDSKQKIPKPQFQVSDTVLVRCDEAGCPPFFKAEIAGIVFDAKLNSLDYTVSENGHLTDGYTEDWLLPYTE